MRGFKVREIIHAESVDLVVVLDQVDDRLALRAHRDERPVLVLGGHRKLSHVRSAVVAAHLVRCTVVASLLCLLFAHLLHDSILDVEAQVFIEVWFLRFQSGLMSGHFHLRNWPSDAVALGMNPHSLALPLLSELLHL